MSLVIFVSFFASFFRPISGGVSGRFWVSKWRPKSLEIDFLAVLLASVFAVRFFIDFYRFFSIPVDFFEPPTLDLIGRRVGCSTSVKMRCSGPRVRFLSNFDDFGSFFGGPKCKKARKRRFKNTLVLETLFYRFLIDFGVHFGSLFWYRFGKLGKIRACFGPRALLGRFGAIPAAFLVDFGRFLNGF